MIDVLESKWSLSAIGTRRHAANAFTTSLFFFVVTEKLLFLFIVIQLKKGKKSPLRWNTSRQIR